MGIVMGIPGSKLCVEFKAENGRQENCQDQQRVIPDREVLSFSGKHQGEREEGINICVIQFHEGLEVSKVFCKAFQNSILFLLLLNRKNKKRRRMFSVLMLRLNTESCCDCYLSMKVKNMRRKTSSGGGG